MIVVPLLSVLSGLPWLSHATPAGDLNDMDGVNASRHKQRPPLIFRNPQTNIGDSEYPGGTKTYCSPSGKYSPQQGELPVDFWSNVEFKTGTSPSGARYAQLTGCIRPEKLDRLNVNDGGGQYDSSGGAGGNGNPAGSACLGYNHYVELVEPGDRRACIKCCDNYDDCPLDKDTDGCPSVIQGNYFNCS